MDLQCEPQCRFRVPGGSRPIAREFEQTYEKIQVGLNVIDNEYYAFICTRQFHGTMLDRPHSVR